MDRLDIEKEKGNKESCWNIFIRTGWIWLLLSITTIMFIVVTIDRYTFHNIVYNEAKTEAIKEKFKGVPVDSLSFSKDSSTITIHVPNEFDIADNNFEKQLKILSKSDGLLNANSLTYLVTLIVALLAALLLFKAEKYETSKEKIHKLTKEAQGLKDELSQLKDESKGDIENLKNNNEREIGQLKEETEGKIEQLTNKTETELTSYYNHIKSYNSYLTTIESLYSLAIMISNTTATLSPSKSDEENENIAKEVAGSLCSRLNLIYDNNIKGSKIDYLTTDEKDILLTYLDDAQSALSRSRRSANRINKEKLKARISDNIDSVKNIKEMIDNMEIRDDKKSIAE